MAGDDHIKIAGEISRARPIRGEWTLARSIALASAVLLSSACAAQERWSAEICSNGKDDNDDEIIDCEDPQCEGSAYCLERQVREQSGQLPNWLDSRKTHPSGRICDEFPDGQEPISWGCDLLPDSCPLDFRCVVLSQGGSAMDTACVRQGCADVREACHPGEFPDTCPRATLCLDAPDVCHGEPCCVPICSQSDASCATCVALDAIYGGADSQSPAQQVYGPSVGGLSGAGACVDP